MAAFAQPAGYKERCRQPQILIQAKFPKSFTADCEDKVGVGGGSTGSDLSKLFPIGIKIGLDAAGFEKYRFVKEGRSVDCTR